MLRKDDKNPLVISFKSLDKSLQRTCQGAFFLNGKIFFNMDHLIIMKMEVYSWNNAIFMNMHECNKMDVPKH